MRNQLALFSLEAFDFGADHLSFKVARETEFVRILREINDIILSQLVGFGANFKLVRQTRFEYATVVGLRR